MSFLAPWFLAGALAVGLPILFHLIRRTIREKQVFSSLMFLLPTPPRVTRQSRLENLLLLLLRCLILLLLAFAFARPFMQKPMAGDSGESAGRQVAVLLDVSASMRREDLWPQAVAYAEAALDSLRPSDIPALYTFDSQLRPQLTLDRSKSMAATDRKAAFRQALAAIKPGWSEAQLGRALIAMADSFDAASGNSDADSIQRQVVLISDLAEGSRLDGLQGHEWPKRMELELRTVKSKRNTNAGLQILAERTEDENSQKPMIRFRVTNSSDAQKEQFKVRVSGGDTNSSGVIDTYVPPGQNRVISTAVTAGQITELRLDGDDADFDNHAYWLPPAQERLRIVYLGSDGEGDPNLPFYYLQRAFSATRFRSFEMVQRRPGESLAPKDIENAALIVATAELGSGQAQLLRSYVRSGRTLLYCLPSDSALVSGLAELLQVGEIRVSEAPKRNFSLFARIDFQHPLFSPFADARFSDFTKIHFWKHRKLSVETLPTPYRVIASFDDESPAWVEVGLGSGAVLLLTSGWTPEESQFALSTKFVPLMYSILDRSRPPQLVSEQRLVGETLGLSELGTNGVKSVRKPDGTELKLAAGASGPVADQPGIYEIVGTGIRIAVNVSPDESRTAPMSLDQLERLGLPLPKPRTARQMEQNKEAKRLLVSTELENRQKLWKWLMVVAFLVVISETWIAGRLIRPARTA